MYGYNKTSSKHMRRGSQKNSAPLILFGKDGQRIQGGRQDHEYLHFTGIYKRCGTGKKQQEKENLKYTRHEAPDSNI
jgi:hypothetical protein